MPDIRAWNEAASPNSRRQRAALAACFFHNNQIEKDPAASADRAASAIFKMREACVLFRTLNKIFIAKRCRLVHELLRAKINICDAIICRIGKRYGEERVNRQPGEPRRPMTTFCIVPAALSHPIAERHTVCWSSPHT